MAPFAWISSHTRCPTTQLDDYLTVKEAAEILDDAVSTLTLPRYGKLAEDQHAADSDRIHKQRNLEKLLKNSESSAE